LKPPVNRLPCNNRSSPPVRGAWIETFLSLAHRLADAVASREGGVD
jgi:hypothetical protein